MTVLITRPKKDSIELAKGLAKVHIPSFVEPMFHVEHENTIKLNLLLEEKIQAVIFTSKHAIAAIQTIPFSRDIPCFVIGEGTEKHAKNAGFSKITNAGGDLSRLIYLIRESYTPIGGTMLYLRGNSVTLDISKYFQQYGINITSIIVYRTIEQKKLSQSLIDQLLSDEIKTAVFFSEKTAKIFLKLIEQLQTKNILKNITIFAISDKVKKIFNYVQCRDKQIFNQNIGTLVKLLNSDYKNDRR